MKSKRIGITSASCRFCLDNMRTVSKDKKILVSASLSCADLLHVSDAVAQINASDIDFVHYDVVDGMFNNCFVFGDLILEKIRPICNRGASCGTERASLYRTVCPGGGRLHCCAL